MSVIVITGAATELGRGIARHLVDQGHDVLLNDPDLRGGREVVWSLQDLAGTATFFPSDLGTSEGARDFVAEAADRHGRIDAVVNTLWSVPAPGRLHELQCDFYEGTLGISLRELHLAMKAELSYFLEQGHGVLVNASSAEAVASPDFEGVTEMLACLARTMANRAALEYAQDNIRVRSFAAGANTSQTSVAQIARILHDEILVTSRHRATALSAAR